MGRIIVEATIENGTDPAFRIRSNALVDTGAAYLTLPLAWRDRLGELMLLDTVSVETATQAVVSGDICGPVLLRMGGFRPLLTEALFIEMEPSGGHDGHYEPLIGYIPLEQAQAAVDLVGHRLVKFGRVDLKPLVPSGTAPFAADHRAWDGQSHRPDRTGQVMSDEKVSMNGGLAAGGTEERRFARGRTMGFRVVRLPVRRGWRCIGRRRCTRLKWSESRARVGRVSRSR